MQQIVEIGTTKGIWEIKIDKNWKKLENNWEETTAYKKIGTIKRYSTPILIYDLKIY